MQPNEDCTRSSSSSPLPSAFTPSFLAKLRRHEESFLERQAVMSGPWEVEALPSGPCDGNGARWAVVRRDERVHPD